MGAGPNQQLIPICEHATLSLEAEAHQFQSHCCLAHLYSGPSINLSDLLVCRIASQADECILLCEHATLSVEVEPLLPGMYRNSVLSWAVVFVGGSSVVFASDGIWSTLLQTKK